MKGGEGGGLPQNTSGCDLVFLPGEYRPDGEFRKPEISAPGKVFVSHCINNFANSLYIHYAHFLLGG